MKLNDYFSKLYVINLKRRSDRYKEAVGEFNKINATVERVEGIDGKTISSSPMKPGAYGLLLTHVHLLENAIKNKLDNFVIFEDDVQFVDNFNELFNEKIDSLPKDWDMLYLGGNHILSVPGFKLVTGDVNFEITKENYKTLRHELCKTPCTYCAHALVISSRMYERILNKIKDQPTQPIDNIYYQLQCEGCNTYTFLPSLATQRGSMSDIEGIYVDYSKMTQVNF